MGRGLVLALGFGPCRPHQRQSHKKKTKEVNKRQGKLYPYTPQFNITGQPSLSLPLGMSSDGLPIGMQFTGRYGDDATLLRLAAQLEEADPWIGRRPPIYG